MEIIANEIQTVAANQNVYFSDTVTGGGSSILHRAGSGLVTLKGNTSQCRARHKVTFGGNIAIPSGGTVKPISLAIALDGEAIPSTIMTITPAATEQFQNVFGAIFIDTPRGCCMSVSVKNINTQSIEVSNANLIIERVA